MNVDIGTRMGRTSEGDGELENSIRTSDGNSSGTVTNIEQTFEGESIRWVGHTGRNGDVNPNEVDGIMMSGGMAEVVGTNVTDVRRCEVERNVCDVRSAAVTSHAYKERCDDRDNGDSHGRGTKRSIEETDEQEDQSGACQEERGVKRTYDGGENLVEGKDDTNVAFSVKERNAGISQTGAGRHEGGEARSGQSYAPTGTRN